MPRCCGRRVPGNQESLRDELVPASSAAQWQHHGRNYTHAYLRPLKRHPVTLPEG